MNAEKASIKATPRLMPTPRPTLAPLDSPEDFDPVPLSGAEVVDCWFDDDDLVFDLEEVVKVEEVEVDEAGRSVA